MEFARKIKSARIHRYRTVRFTQCDSHSAFLLEGDSQGTICLCRFAKPMPEADASNGCSFALSKSLFETAVQSLNFSVLSEPTDT